MSNAPSWSTAAAAAYEALGAELLEIAKKDVDWRALRAMEDAIDQHRHELHEALARADHDRKPRPRSRTLTRRQAAALRKLRENPPHQGISRAIVEQAIGSYATNVVKSLVRHGLVREVGELLELTDVGAAIVLLQESHE